MSTKLTIGDNAMLDSNTLKLVFASATVNEMITQYLAMMLDKKGYQLISVSRLQFLSALDCGVNIGSDIARKLNISRQMVAKSVKELCEAGYLQQQAGVGRQKLIMFTPLGEQLIAQARALLADLDQVFQQQLSYNSLVETLSHLDNMQTAMSELLALPSNDK